MTQSGTGYRGVMLMVDLSRRQISTRALDPEVLTDYLGGRGLAMRLLCDMAPVGVEPLASDNPLIFATGPCAGTLVPASSRSSVAAKSPLTGLLGSGNVGSLFTFGLKGAGFDVLVVSGASPVPVYLLVGADGAHIVDCPELWGQDTIVATRALRQRHGCDGVGIACIGPAGENCVPLASIIFDASRSAGRGGLGAVMGAKKLKAIVAWGDEPVFVDDPSGLMHYCAEYTAALKRESYYKRYSIQGTGVIAQPMHDTGRALINNGRDGLFPGIEALSPHVINTQYRLRQYACPACPMPCGQLYAVSGAPGRDSEGAWGRGSGNASIIMGFGPRCGQVDLRSIAAAYALSNALGIDLISANAVAAFAIECFETGRLGRQDVDGLELRSGNGDAVLRLLYLIARGQGVGKLLGRGVREASRIIGQGSEHFAPHVKGLEMMETEPRGHWSWGLMFAVSSRGACHTRAYDVTEMMDLADEDLMQAAGTLRARDSNSTEGKGQSVAFFENIRALADSMEICRFVSRGRLGFAEALGPLLRFVTGCHIDTPELEAVGERIINLERLYNLREGLSPADDTLPDRYLVEPLPNGSASGRVVPLSVMLTDYYRARGWDAVSGAPSEGTLHRLRLPKIV
ncbi:MAG: aldehyde ferredoxin oxidoreductase family protein [Dehalococcoidia bacterium]|nr:aldehyde ferredoxin oxidoreductase family protein [Dehalococcoidia bacterium]